MRRAAAFVAAASLCIGLASADGGNTNWDGVYERQIENAYVDGERFVSTDSLTIIGIDRQSAYVEIDLTFTNAHMCSFAGVFHVEGESLVYRDRVPPPEFEPCVFTISRTGDGLAFDDHNGACRAMTCGARAGYNGEVFGLAARRPITEADREHHAPQIAAAQRQTNLFGD
jgi:hypothetical protein